MKKIKQLGVLCLFAGGIILATLKVFADPPVLSISSLGTNIFSITITNGVSGGNYELWWTPVLGDTVDYPWTTAAVGTSGQTNFLLNMTVYQTGFFRALQDTNTIPLWEAADPNNPATGILNVWIDSPANGTTLN